MNAKHTTAAQLSKFFLYASAYAFACVSAIALIYILTACSGKDINTKETASPDQITAPSEQTLPLIDSAGISDYVIIRSADANKEELDAAVALRDAIAARYGVTLELKIDLLKASAGYTEAEHEILVGWVDRDARRDCTDKLVKTGDWLIELADEKLIVCGKTSAATSEAASALIAALPAAPSEGEALYLTDALSAHHTMQTELNSIKIGETELSSCRIYLPAGMTELTRAALTELCEALEARYGMQPSQTDDAALAAEGRPGLYLGEAAASFGGDAAQGQDDGTILSTDGRLLITGQTIWDTLRALNALTAAIKTAPRGDLVFPDGYRLACPRTESYRVMTYNILTTTSTLEARKPLVLRVIAEQLPDTLGVQEANPDWMAFLRGALGEIYASVGVGREGGDTAASGEFTAIFYNKLRFDLIESGTIWLSDTPDIPSKYDDSKQKRICTWAVLADKVSGERFVHLNTHLDNKGADARAAQQEVLRTKLDSFTYPVILTGDMNHNENSPLYAKMTAENPSVHRAMVDAESIAVRSKPYATYNGLGSASTTLDYIFLTAGDFSVSSHTALPRIYHGVYPSDHNAVSADLTLLS